MFKYSLHNSNHILTFFSLILISILISSIQSKKNIMILEGDQLDYVIKNSSQSNTKLFLVFHITRCIYCRHALQVLQENIVKSFDEDDPISFGIINLEDQKNIWTGLRFNITKIPYIILIDKDKMYYYQNSFEEKLVMNFIKEEKNIEDALDIPPPVGFFGKLKAAMNELNEKIEVLLGKYGIKKEFSSKICYIIVIVGFILLFYFEYKVIEFAKSICGKKNKNENKGKPQVKKNEQDEDNKKEKVDKKEKKE